MDHLSGIVLAGGKSSRMGTDKGLLHYKGKRLVEYSIDLLRGYCNELIISSNNPEYEQFGLPLVGDEYPEKGPAGGLFSALRKSSTDWNLVLACDMPYLNGPFIHMLISNTDNFEGVVPVHDGQIEPLAAIYHKEMVSYLEEEIHNDQLSMYKILKASRIHFLPVGELLDKHPLLFKNLNTVSDIKTSGKQKQW